MMYFDTLPHVLVLLVMSLRLVTMIQTAGHKMVVTNY